MFKKRQSFWHTLHCKISLYLSQGSLACGFLRKRVASPMIELLLGLVFLSSTLFFDFETRFLLAFPLDSGLKQAQLVYFLWHIDIFQTPSPSFGFDELKIRDVISFSSLDAFVSSEDSHLKIRKESLIKEYYSCKITKVNTLRTPQEIN